MKLFRRRFTRPGASPGTVAEGPPRHEPVVSVLSYDATNLAELRGTSVEEALRLVAPGRVTWIDCSGLGDGQVVRELGLRLGLHALTVSDVINTGQRPKVESYEDQLFLIVRMVTLDAERHLQWEQVSIILGEHFVLSFQETQIDCLDGLRERIRSGRRQIRSSGPDYLACMIVDAIVDGYFPLLEHYGEQIEALEADVFASPGKDILGAIYRTRRDLTAFRRAILPLREALVHLQRDASAEGAPIGPEARLYLRDTIDHAAQVLDVNEDYDELTANLVEMHLSLTTRKTNEVIRVLTVVATIFIPPTFLASVYGMNFDRAHPANMPELGWTLGYPFFWVLCAATTAVLLGVFFRLGWLRR